MELASKIEGERVGAGGEDRGESGGGGGNGGALHPDEEFKDFFMVAVARVSGED